MVDLFWNFGQHTGWLWSLARFLQAKDCLTKSRPTRTTFRFRTIWWDKTPKKSEVDLKCLRSRSPMQPLEELRRECRSRRWTATCASPSGHGRQDAKVTQRSPGPKTLPCPCRSVIQQAGETFPCFPYLTWKRETTRSLFFDVLQL